MKKKRIDPIDLAELNHERYGNLDAPDDVPLSYHIKRFIGAVLLGAVLFVVVIYLTTVGI